MFIGVFVCIDKKHKKCYNYMKSKTVPEERIVAIQAWSWKIQDLLFTNS